MSYSPDTAPSDELRHFTDRDHEQLLLRRALRIASGGELPVLAFHGVGGVGKTWLRRRFETIQGEELPGSPHAVVDFDLRTDGARYSNPADAWFEIATRLKIPCPRFFLAYAVMQAKQCAKQVEAKQLSSGEQSKLELAGQLAPELMGADWVKAATDGIPLLGLVPYFAGKGVERLAEKRLERDPDFIALEALEPEDIYKKLLPRFIQDLNAHTSPHSKQQCHSVVYFDTFEALGDGTHKALQIDREKWIRQFARGVKRTLVVVLGQNLLRWDEDDPYWKQPHKWIQHPVGSLDEADARLFLSRCEIVDGALQNEVLKDSSCAPQPGYHPFTLGLCADTLYAERENRGNDTFPPAEEFFFEAGEHGPRAIVERFLRTQNDARRFWLERLAVTRRFDKTAALSAYSETVDVDSEAAWLRLREFSFLSRTESDWFVLHSHLRSQILASLSADRLREEHLFWQQHWKGRIRHDTDAAAELAWFHTFHLDPEAARGEYDALAERKRAALQMGEHHLMVNWPAALQGERGIATSWEWAALMYSWGLQLTECTLGERAANLHEAITCFDAALTVCTRDAFPQDWAMTQNNKGIALRNLPDGDRGAQLREAIACYDAALTVYTRDAFPQRWATTQNNKGTSLAILPDGDQGAQLREAIACFDAALTVRTRDAFPQQWATTQTNKGNALQSLPDGDRGAQLREAIACFDAALTVRTRDAFPQDWAMTQNNKGVALRNLPDGDQGAQLREAIACYDAALTVRTRDAFPQDWAATQNNKGTSLAILPDGDQGAQLREAIACYDAALTVYTRDAFPQSWAMTQNNKGIALRNLPDGDQGAQLREAIACYDAALTVRTRDTFPQDWAMTQANKSLLLAALRDWQQALACAEAAIGGFRQVGHIHYLQMAEHNKQIIEDAMKGDEAAE